MLWYDGIMPLLVGTVLILVAEVLVLVLVSAVLELVLEATVLETSLKTSLVTDSENEIISTVPSSLDGEATVPSCANLKCRPTHGLLGVSSLNTGVVFSFQ